MKFGNLQTSRARKITTIERSINALKLVSILLLINTIEYL